ncbi:MAG: hypothetical protein Q4E28_01060 [Clostridia bacterium]|nr:hypothetical protein [Clostridia bacterium]
MITLTVVFILIIVLSLLAGVGVLLGIIALALLNNGYESAYDGAGRKAYKKKNLKKQ